jgi:uncharacterized protein
MEPFQLLVKPVSFDCNLRCNYCFYLRVANLYPKIQKPRMNYELLEKMICQYLQFRFKESIFNWQGGEPTLCGLPFFKKVVEFQQQYGISGQVIGNAFQTNGILINDEWANFFNDYSFLIGLSLDGPKQIHDRYRKSIGGKSVWEKVMKAAEIFKRNNVEFNILCVISKANVNRVEEIYNFFVDNDLIYLQFIPALEADETGKKSSFCINSSQYGKFLCELYDVWIKSNQQASIRFFDGILAHHLGFPKGYCILEELCANYLVVEWNGDIYPCDFFVYDKYKLGNLQKDNFSKLIEKRNESFRKLKKQLPHECLECKWKELCYGGCLKDRFFPDNPHPDKTYFCQSYKKFFSYANNWLKEKAFTFKKN